MCELANITKFDIAIISYNYLYNYMLQYRFSYFILDKIDNNPMICVYWNIETHISLYAVLSLSLHLFAFNFFTLLRRHT